MSLPSPNSDLFPSVRSVKSVVKNLCLRIRTPGGIGDFLTTEGTDHSETANRVWTVPDCVPGDAKSSGRNISLLETHVTNQNGDGLCDGIPLITTSFRESINGQWSQASDVCASNQGSQSKIARRPQRFHARRACNLRYTRAIFVRGVDVSYPLQSSRSCDSSTKMHRERTLHARRGCNLCNLVATFEHSGPLVQSSNRLTTRHHRRWAASGA